LIFIFPIICDHLEMMEMPADTRCHALTEITICFAAAAALERFTKWPFSQPER
jgi:hypothetical protein